MPETAQEFILGFDYGARRIGVAVGQNITKTASPAGVVANLENGPDWPAIAALIGEWRPAALVIGMPYSEAGGEQPMSQAARAFGKILGERFKLPVFEQDERYSSRQAAAEFAQARNQGSAKRKHAKLLDAHAARVIVENFLASNKRLAIFDAEQEQ